MANIRRYFKPGQICFLTHVTYERLPILVHNIDLLWQAMETVRTAHRLELIAWAVLPDHIHLLVDSEQVDVSASMHQMKQKFSALLRSRHGSRSGRLWQNRFWDHIIRDEDDLKRHIEYIHYNPVKHGLARGATEYPYSSFGEFVAQGLYDETWGVLDDFNESDFGE